MMMKMTQCVKVYSKKKTPLGPFVVSEQRPLKDSDKELEKRREERQGNEEMVFFLREQSMESEGE